MNQVAAFPEEILIQSNYKEAERDMRFERLNIILSPLGRNPTEIRTGLSLSLCIHNPITVPDTESGLQ